MHRSPSLRTACLLILFSFCLLSEMNTKHLVAQLPEKKLDIELSDRKWTTLLLLRGSNPQAEPIPVKVPLKSVSALEFEGPQLGHPHLLGSFKADGKFVIQNGMLQRQLGNSALVQLPSADSFELEGKIALKGEGGWLILFGWNEEDRSGYCLYHTQLRLQGAPWRLCEIKEGKAVEGSERELVKEQSINGVGSLLMSVDEKSFTLKILNHTIIDDYTLKNYQPGAIMIGTYNPRYGAKQLGIYSLRMKAR